MKHFILIFLVPAILCTTPTYAKGHGGGHGGGHSHSGGHSGERNGVHNPAGGNTAGRRNTTRTTSGGVRGINQTRGISRNNTLAGPRTVINGTPAPVAPYEHWNSYPYYYYGSYGYSPYYDPYFNMWSFGLNFMYTPHYAPPSTDNGENGNNEQLGKEPLQGFVVYEHDTIQGDITIKKNAVSLETVDSGKNYDYKFKLKQQGLQYIAVYDNSDDNNRLDLVRLKEDKKLLRIVHTGKLNIYDGHTGFIYRPEDIDVSTIVVVYNGHEEAIHSASVHKTKEWLTDLVNNAYGLDLNPKDFKWNELLIYIDKLD